MKNERLVKILENFDFEGIKYEHGIKMYHEPRFIICDAVSLLHKDKILSFAINVDRFTDEEIIDTLRLYKWSLIYENFIS